MSQPVWVLSVDLQTKTATFQSGMADAAKSARGAFTDIKSGASDMGRSTGGSMMEARHGVMLLGEEFGVHLPRALTSFIASIGPVGAAMEAAFPFLAIAVGATLLIQHLEKMHEAGEKLTQDQVQFGTSVQNAFNQLDQKLIEARIKTDELRKDHLGAVRDELELIDKQSLEELVHSFGEVAKAADVVFADLKTSWYQFGTGSTGAKHALDTFKTSYDSLLAQGKDKEASDLLSGTLQSAQKIQGFMAQYKASQFTSGDKTADNSHADYAKFEEAKNALKAAGVGVTEKEVTAQNELVAALNAQVELEQKVQALKASQSTNVHLSEAHKGDSEAEKAARKQAEEQAKLQREYDQNFKQGWDYQINMTRAGSSERLAVLASALEAAKAIYGEDAEMTRRYAADGYKAWAEAGDKTLETIAKQLDEQDKLQAEAGKESAENAAKMGELSLAAYREHQSLLDSAHRMTEDHRLAEEIEKANEEYSIKQAAFGREAAALDKNAKDYENKLKAIQDKETQLAQQHENEITAIKDKAEIDRNQKVLAEAQKFNDTITGGLTQVIMGHKSFASMMDGIGNQVVSGMIQNAIKMMEANLMGKESDAAKAARAAYNIGISMGGPAGMILGPTFAALAFSTVTGFAGGGIVPGVGTGDIVPAMLTPGEGVIPGGVMEGLSQLARSGGLNAGGHHYHVTTHVRLNASALDADGMDTVLEKHGDKLQRHFENTIRKMNR